MKIRCIAIDDDPPALQQIVDYIENVPFLELVATFKNGIEPMQYLKENEVDLIFLDIQMEKFTGIQFLNTLKKRPKVILTTAYENYAIKAYELNVSDYLLKPISFERFIQSVEKVYDQIFNEKSQKNEITPSQHYKKDYVFIKSDYRLIRIDFKDILYIQGMSEYLSIFLADGSRVVTRMVYKEMEELLPQELFIRVHKSYMVALRRIEMVEKNRIKIGDEIIPVGDTYQKEFYKRINE